MRDKHFFVEQLRIDAQDKLQISGVSGLLVLGAIALFCLVAVSGFIALYDKLRTEPVSTAAPALERQPTTVTPSARARAPALKVFEATGYLVATRSANVAPEVGGRIVELLVEEGGLVKTGQLIARLADQTASDQVALQKSEVQSEITALEESGANLRNARDLLARDEPLFQSHAISQVALENDKLNVARELAKSKFLHSRIEVARRNLQLVQDNLRRFLVRAPIAGVVTKRVAQVGDYVAPASYNNSALCTIIDRESMVAEINVSEANVGKVKEGERVSVTLNGYPGVTFGGRVAAILPVADRQSGTVKMQVKFDVLDDRMRPETGVRAAFFQE
jgi:RND family efflux transporter MFP subunit